MVREENNKQEISEIQEQGRSRIVAFAPINEVGWLVAVEKDKATILQGQFQDYAKIFAIACLVFGLMALSVHAIRHEFLSRRTAKVSVYALQRQ